MLISSTINANWLYDSINAIDDAGIAVSGVIVDGVNGVAYGATSLWEHTIGLCAIHEIAHNLLSSVLLQLLLVHQPPPMVC
jgi:hypothetical protein